MPYPSAGRHADRDRSQSGEGALKEAVIEERPADVGRRGADQLADFNLLLLREDLEPDQMADDECPRRPQDRRDQREPPIAEAYPAAEALGPLEIGDDLINSGELRPRRARF